MVEKEGGEGQKEKYISEFVPRDVNSQTGYISSYTENISFLVGRNENKSFRFRHHSDKNFFLAPAGALETQILSYLFICL